MEFNTIEELKEMGFQGFKKMSDLFSNSSSIPAVQGVYMILYLDNTIPEFLKIGTGGFFKNKNPNVNVEELKRNWIQNTKVIYIGKATILQKRLKQYFSFGQGKNIGHYGGRFIWQIKNSKELIVCWKPLAIEDPKVFEANLIKQFKSKFGNRPFANLQD